MIWLITVLVVLAIVTALLLNFSSNRNWLSERVNHLQQNLPAQRMRDNPQDYLNNWFLRIFLPARNQARQATQAAQQALDDADAQETTALKAFDGQAPATKKQVGIIVGAAFWVLVVVSNACLDWGLDDAFTGNVLTATALTVGLVSVPVLLTILAQQLPPKSASESERERRRLAVVGLIICYLVLFGFVGWLGTSRANYDYLSKSYQYSKDEQDQEKKDNNYYRNLIDTASRNLIQDKSDNESAEVQSIDQTKQNELQKARTAALKADEKQYNTRRDDLNSNRTQSAQKWVLFAILLSVAESGLSLLCLIPAVLLLRLYLARRRKSRATATLRAAQSQEAALPDNLVGGLAEDFYRNNVPTSTLQNGIRTVAADQQLGQAPALPGTDDATTQLPGGAAPSSPMTEQTWPTEPAADTGTAASATEPLTVTSTEPPTPSPAEPTDLIETTPGFNEA